MSFAVTMKLGVKTPMRDGVGLSADLYLPAARGPFPTVLMRTPYDNNNWNELFRTLPLIDADHAAGRDLPAWEDWVRHASYDHYWQETSNHNKWGEIAAPAFNMGGWYDLYSKATFENFNGLRRHGRTPEARQSKLICGAWAHALSAGTRCGDVDFGAASMVDLETLELRWLDYWLKGIPNGIVDEPPLRLFVMGVNEWRDEHEWPLARTQWQEWYLHSGGGANSLMGDGALDTQAPSTGDSEAKGADPFLYDPDNPVPTTGGNNCCSPHIVPWGPYDQRLVEMRSDVLCYTSAPLAQDLEVTGPITLTLYAATDASDTDWTAKLVDVSPGGYARNLCDGIVRARYREDRAAPRLLEPGKVYAYEIDLWVTSNVFRAGHRLRLEVSSSNFPRFDRNLNTGHEHGMDAERRVAHQTVLHSRAYPSRLRLPVIPPA